MPSRERPGVSSAIRQIQQQARSLLAEVRKEIKIKEQELEKLREEERRLGILTGDITVARSMGSNSARTDWRAVLTRLPKEFKASHIRAIPGMQNKRPSEIFAAVTRWIEAGMVKRKARGLYERIA